MTSRGGSVTPLRLRNHWYSSTGLFSNSYCSESTSRLSSESGSMRQSQENSATRISFRSPVPSSLPSPHFFPHGRVVTAWLDGHPGDETTGVAGTLKPASERK